MWMLLIEGGKTALMHAARYGHTDIVNALAGTHNANVDAVDGMADGVDACRPGAATPTP
jgi:ankyrin repeat protein